MIFSWEIQLMMKAAEEGLVLMKKANKIKKSFVVKPYEIPEHLKIKTNES